MDERCLSAADVALDRPAGRSTGILHGIAAVEPQSAEVGSAEDQDDDFGFASHDGQPLTEAERDAMIALQHGTGAQKE